MQSRCAPATGQGADGDCRSGGWNVIEAIVAIGAGIASGSIALVGFGLDSSIEGFAATVVLWQLRGAEDEARKNRALKLIAISFFVLAA